MPESLSMPLIESFALGPFATNCYVVRAPDTDECWIVDAGIEPGDMIDAIRRHQLHPVRIFLTHAHVDHIAGLGEVRAAFPDVPVLIHQAEKDWLAEPQLNLSCIMGEPFSTSPPDELLEGGETYALGDARFRILFTPGHSPGGVTLYSAESATALVGDTLFADSIGRYDFPTSDGPTLFKSIRDILYALPEETRVLPGHGPPTTIGREKTSNPFVQA